MLDAKRTNRLLKKLSVPDYRRLSPAFETVELRFGQVLYQPEERIKHVYFPVTCLVSLVVIVGKGQLAEVGLVGNEGAVGGAAALGDGVSSFRAIVQGAGTAIRVKAPRLNGSAGAVLSLQQHLLKFSHLLTAQVAQTAACNRFHVVSARLARWLLMTRDRQFTNEFRMTQEFLSHMLGVRRPGVSLAASQLKKKNIIRYSRGKITILNEAALAAAACSCYLQVRRLYERS